MCEAHNSKLTIQNSLFDSSIQFLYAFRCADAAQIKEYCVVHDGSNAVVFVHLRLHGIVDRRRACFKDNVEVEVGAEETFLHATMEEQ